MIKAFNNYAQHLLECGKPAGNKGRIALPVAGDDSQAKAVVMPRELGFDAVEKVVSMNRGGSSPPRPCTELITMLKECGERLHRQVPNTSRSGAQHR